MCYFYMNGTALHWRKLSYPRLRFGLNRVSSIQARVERRWRLCFHFNHSRDATNICKRLFPSISKTFFALRQRPISEMDLSSRQHSSSQNFREEIARISWRERRCSMLLISFLKAASSEEHLRGKFPSGKRALCPCPPPSSPRRGEE